MLQKVFRIDLKISKAAIFLLFFFFFFSLSAEESKPLPASSFASNSSEEELVPTVAVSFKKQSEKTLYTIAFGKRTKFNVNENAPYKFLFLDETKREIGAIPKDFFKKNREGSVKYASNGKESFVQFMIPICLYDKSNTKAQKCTVVTKTLTVK